MFRQLDRNRRLQDPRRLVTILLRPIILVSNWDGCTNKTVLWIFRFEIIWKLVFDHTRGKAAEKELMKILLALQSLWGFMTFIAHELLNTQQLLFQANYNTADLYTACYNEATKRNINTRYRCNNVTLLPVLFYLFITGVVKFTYKWKPF